MSDDLPYKAEYAKSGRAGCKGCKTNIAQDSLRIARMVQVCLIIWRLLLLPTNGDILYIVNFTDDRFVLVNFIFSSSHI